MKKSCVCLLLIACMLLALVGCACKHSYSEEWYFDDTHHWHVCVEEDCDEQSEKGEHDWDEGAVTLAPTATAEGVRTYACKVCAKTRTESLAVISAVDTTGWADAFLLQAENYKIGVMTTFSQESWLVEKRGQITKVHNSQAADGKESFFAVESGKYYRYDKVGELVTKQEITKRAYESATTLVDLQGLTQASYTYSLTTNEGDKIYKAAQHTLNGIVYENIWISFNNGQIKQLGFTKKEQGKADDAYGIAVTYGFVANDIVLPQVTQ